MIYLKKARITVWATGLPGLTFCSGGCGFRIVCRSRRFF